MKRKLAGFSRRYFSALGRHLKRGRRSGLLPAGGLGREAMSAGIGTLALARIHEQALSALILPGDSPDLRRGVVRRAGTFFSEAVTPIEKTHRTAWEANAGLNQLIQTLSQRSVELTTANRRLREEI